MRRAFLEGRLSEEHLVELPARNRRQRAVVVLPSVPDAEVLAVPDRLHGPRAAQRDLPGALHALSGAPEHSARPASGKVWAFVGDGEMDEPESLAGLSLAAREGLDNLIFVVNCNLQRLDGPVRGNGSIVQELEGLFAGAGWNVIKLLWGSDWDPLFARDEDGVLLKRLHETVDGEFQTYAATDGALQPRAFLQQVSRAARADRRHERRRHRPPAPRRPRPGEDLRRLPRGLAAQGPAHGDPRQDQEGLRHGHWGQGKMGTHQQKKLDDEALREFRDRFALPLSDEDVAQLRFFHPGPDSPEIKYLLEHSRKASAAIVPSTKHQGAKRWPCPPLSASERNQSTTMVFVQLLSQLLKDEKLGPRVVPIVADEARTFGMQTLFRQVGIYSAVGQLYEPEDHDELLYYREAKDGQILEEGITEAGALSSWLAAATAYSAHGTPMLPFYIYYSMFGFQRVGDLIWAAADSRARGFLVGGTAGRTTLAGEGLQHQDGSSHLVASTIPNCRAYDPCFGYELATIVEDGARRMLEAQEDVFYYLTVANENYAHPAMPQRRARGHPERHVLTSAKAKMPRSSCSAAGPILREVIAAAELLEKDWKIVGRRVERDLVHRAAARRHGGRARHGASAAAAKSWVEQCLEGDRGPGDRRERLRERGRRPDPALRPEQVRGARHRRLRPQRHARRAARLLRGGCAATSRSRRSPRSTPSLVGSARAPLRDRPRGAAPLGAVKVNGRLCRFLCFPDYRRRQDAVRARRAIFCRW